eukprot:CAMPEP_0174853956 /NCGR_PEP_ID=MMETSP1114-20130205/29654_1 /TAXON_ID=312471 /ORGANISM="Neobodo designis, Strain CCAP 1951/1" /LENGTH=715 /DNA_ID=CAMNT_0016088623 /DNA_START=43 /DNA_END=2190 /DNA_ORIENTATION=-
MTAVLGIDIGTSVTRLAQMTADRKMPIILRNALSNESTPTLVSYPDEGMRLYGEAALGKELSRPQQTTMVLKQSLAADPSDANAVAALARTGTPIAVNGDRLVYALGDSEYTPTQVLGFYLAQVSKYATEEAGQLCLVAPVAAPARFRAALKDAAAVAGVSAPVVTVVDEADALVAYMHHLRISELPEAPEEATKALIVNVGESFTSVVAASLSKPEATVLAAGGLAVGTSLVDCALAETVFAAIKAKHGEDVSTHAKSHNKVMRECKKAKVMLSTTDRVHAQFECLKGDIDHQMPLTVSDLAAASKAYAEQLAAVIAEVMAAAGLEKGCRVEAVGNGWRSPLITAAVKEATGADRVGLSLDSNMCAAEGAAIAGVVASVAASAAVAAAAGEEKAPESPNSTVDPVHTVKLGRADSCPAPVAADATDSALVAQWREAEAALDAKDAVEREQLRALNDFESCLFQTREVAGHAFADDADASTKIMAFLEAEETWLYDARDGLIEGFSTGMIQERLEAMKAKVEAEFPQVAKYREEEAAKQKAKDEELARLAKENEGEKELKSDPQRLRGAQERREQGVNLFKQEHFQEAQKRFVQALSILAELYDNTGDNKAKKEEIALSCHLNIASCSVKQGLWKIAVSNCTKALEIKPDHPKALYRRGQAQAQLHEHEEAIKDLEKALELSNGDAAVQAELDAVKQRVAAAKAKEKKLFSKMFA